MRCFVCEGVSGLEEHHLIEQAAGGTSGATVWLCATCHTNAHKTATALASQNPKTREKRYGDPENFHRLMIIVNYLMLGRLLYRDNREHLQHHATSLVSVNVSPSQLERLHQIKMKAGFANLEAMMLHTIAKLTGLKSWPKGSPPNSKPPS